MATKVSMSLLNPSSSRIQIQMPKSSASHQMLFAKTSPFLTMAKTTPNSRSPTMQIGSNSSRSSLVMKKSRGCSSCGGR
jgi:hypothetical protein